MHHKIKLNINYYEPVAIGDKPFEIRFNDRGYQKGDTVEFVPVHDTGVAVTGKQRLYGKITYVLSYHQETNWVVFGFKLDLK